VSGATGLWGGLFFFRGRASSKKHNAVLIPPPPPPPPQKNNSSPTNHAALLALLALVFLAAPASAARSLKQVDSSIRQELVKDRIIAKLRRGASADEADTVTSIIGKGNFEKRTSLRTGNNLLSTLGKYAQPTDTGARGQVAARVQTKLAKNYDGDTEDFTNFVQAAAAKNIRLTLLRADSGKK